MNGAPDLVPRFQLGYLLPVRVGDNVQHQFYHVCATDMMLVPVPGGLERFDQSAVEAMHESLLASLDFLIKRGVDRIVQGGIPVSAFMGRPGVRRFLEEARRRTDIPVTADFEDVLEALHELGARRIAVGAKWDANLMRRVSAYLDDAGIETLGQANDPHTAREVMEIAPAEGVELALRLGRRAFQAAPDADALLLAGGAWLSLQAIPALEREFGKPVVTNPSATYWAAMRQHRAHSPRLGWGRLIDGLHPDAPPLGMRKVGT
jgi:maleate cis-trans isomerase